jgi:hypothetical protein
MNVLHKTLSNIRVREIRLGYREVVVFSPENLDEEQIGFSRGEDGSILSGDSPGDWRKNWIVVGREDETGDPLFVDSGDSALPVYTAIHGEGEWEPELLSTSFSGFIEALMAIHDISGNRDNPVKLDSNPLSESEAEKLLAKISKSTKVEDVSFWESWITTE